MKKIISWRTLAEGIDASVSTAKRLEKNDPDFPRRVRVSPGRVGFFEDEVDEYIAARERVELKTAEAGADPAPDTPDTASTRPEASGEADESAGELRQGGQAA